MDFLMIEINDKRSDFLKLGKLFERVLNLQLLWTPHDRFPNRKQFENL